MTEMVCPESMGNINDCLMNSGGMFNILNIQQEISITGILKITSLAIIPTGAYNDFDVATSCVIKADTSGGDVIINGFSGGVVGQILVLFKTDDLNNFILNHKDEAGVQKIFCQNGIGIMNNNGIVIVYCDGVNWRAN